MIYTLPSDEALLDAFFSEPIGSFSAFRAVARLAIETWIAEAVQASGVDVEALAESAVATACANLRPTTEVGERARAHFQKQTKDALRTAIAQAVARLSPPPSAAAPDAPR